MAALLCSSCNENPGATSNEKLSDVAEKEIVSGSNYYKPDTLVHDIFLNGAPPYLNSIKGYSEEDTITGDFNGDGKVERAWLKDNSVKSALDPDSVLAGIVIFSDLKVPRLIIEQCPFGFLQNEGDLNGDGTDEIGILPGWTTSACRTYLLFALNAEGWEEKLAVGTAENQRQEGVRPVTKHPTEEGKVIVKYRNDNCPGCCCSWSETKDTIIDLREENADSK